MKYSLVLPCKDEEQTLEICIKKARKGFDKYNIKDYEIIVVDNNSIDNSISIARKLGVKIVKESVQGYGAALLRGFHEAKGEYIIMCDADDTYSLEELPLFLKYKNKDIVIGNRFNKKMKKGAMSFMHRYVGNPLFSTTSKMFFKIPCSDTHSGFRMIKKQSIKSLNLQSSGMELASEMLIKAQRFNMTIAEVNITYSKRIGKSKLQSFNDGWRHLKTILLYSPKHLFFLPGIFLFIGGLILMLLTQFRLLRVTKEISNNYLILIGSAFAILGFQLILLWIYAKTYSIIQSKEKDLIVEYIHNKVSLEKTIGIGVTIMLISIFIGVIISLYPLTNYTQTDIINLGIFALTIMLLGIQTIAAGFMLSILGNKR